MSESIYVSDLTTSKHIFNKYHFCRGNSNKRKSRLGIILKGYGTYIHLNKRTDVSPGDVVFIPENIYCYSEWKGDPEIEVIYVSGFIHFDKIQYEPQIIHCEEKTKKDIIHISELLNSDSLSRLDAYSEFYKVLKTILPKMEISDISLDKTLNKAIGFITDNWNKINSVGEIAKICCVSESGLYHLFQKHLGQTPIRFLNSIKINVAIEYLENRDLSVASLSELVGFNSENHFRKVFREFTGTTPLKYKKISMGT